MSNRTPEGEIYTLRVYLSLWSDWRRPGESRKIFPRHCGTRIWTEGAPDCPENTPPRHLTSLSGARCSPWLGRWGSSCLPPPPRCPRRPVSWWRARLRADWPRGSWRAWCSPGTRTARCRTSVNKGRVHLILICFLIDRSINLDPTHTPTLPPCNGPFDPRTPTTPYA